MAATRGFQVQAGGGALRNARVRVAIKDLFDKSPPIVADPNGPGYSPYGDPRGRRFEVTLTSTF